MWNHQPDIFQLYRPNERVAYDLSAITSNGVRVGYYKGELLRTPWTIEPAKPDGSCAAEAKGQKKGMQSQILVQAIRL